MFRRAMKRAVQNAMRAGAQGVKIQVGGRLGGAEIARQSSTHSEIPGVGRARWRVCMLCKALCTRNNLVKVGSSRRKLRRRLSLWLLLRGRLQRTAAVRGRALRVQHQRGMVANLVQYELRLERPPH